MCGRYATTRSAGDLSALFEAYDDTGGQLVADYNVAPTDPVPIVRTLSGRRTLSVARWGLVPPWAKSPAVGARMINARVETVATSRAYAAPFARRRCLVPADGWYEWMRRETGGKQAYFLTPRGGGVIAFAGVWSLWGDPDRPLVTCSVLTTDAAGELTRVHPRMPLLLPPERWTPWLAEGRAEPELLAAPSPQWLATIEIRPVGPQVGNVRNNGPGLVERVPEPVTGVDPAPEKTRLF